LKPFLLVSGVILCMLLLSCPSDGDSNSPPTAVITSPQHEDLFMCDGEDEGGLYKTLTLQGTAADEEDDDATLLVEWFSSTDGKLGEGRELTARVHMTEPVNQIIYITLRVTDSKGLSTEFGIQIGLHVVG
jgi:hypothetical protein